MNTSQTIRSLRIESGLSYKDLAAKVGEIRGVSLTERAAVQWEWRGVRSGELEDALAEALGVSVAVIREASKASRINPGPKLHRGGRNKNHEKCFSS